MTPALFSVLAVLLVASALSVVLQPSPIRSALSLVVTLFLLAVTFLLLDAHLVAALQVIVYAGAILVLFLFVIMLLNLQEEPTVMVRMGTRLFAAMVGSLFLLAAIRFFVRVPAGPGAGMGGGIPESFGTTQLLAERLFTHFLLAFEVTSVLLLVAIVGAVVLAKRTLA